MVYSSAPKSICKLWNIKFYHTRGKMICSFFSNKEILFHMHI
uniref:Uncharacterized protein n=1 Tax=Arundo donax TaxID=35708 RepID=A0A0A9EQW0_ARUDO